MVIVTDDGSAAAVNNFLPHAPPPPEVLPDHVDAAVAMAGPAEPPAATPSNSM
jgi:hypothetical protein